MSLNVGYFTNTYPMASQTFIRREIAAMEEMGVPVVRYAIRAWDTPLVDPGDIAEAARTRRILDIGMPRLLFSLVGAFFGSPLRFTRVSLRAWKLGRISKRGMHYHLAYLAEACVLRRWTARDGIGHLHVHFATNSATVALLCRLLGGPAFSITVHGPEEFDHTDRLALGTKVKHAAFVVAISSFGRSQIWRWADPADWHKVHVVHCGLDPSFLAGPATPPPAEPRLVNIGRLHEQKGQLLLVEAAAILRDQGRSFVVVIIGGGPLHDELAERIRVLNLEAHVLLVGWKTGEQVRQEIQAARAMVLPSFAEGLPVVIMEAFALHRPVISTYIAGIPELVRPGENGWLVPAGDETALAAAIAQVLDAPPDQLARLGQAGADRVARDHDIRTEARKLLDLIESSVG
ncbi:MAG TPA: glycosyltransferase family 4 protein [Fimbriiglobus sp.]|jgi:glycosyltransferase involved in cell wall biosynthesis